MNIRLCEMTKELCRRYFRNFAFDPDLFADMTRIKPYVYDVSKCDATVDRYRAIGRVYLAIMLDEEPIGEVVLKDIDQQKKHCTMGIHLQCDTYKNRGYGTAAEILTLAYAFDEMGMQTVFADTIHKNTRSQHVLKKVGFIETHRDDRFIYYRCDKSSWRPQT